MQSAGDTYAIFCSLKLVIQFYVQFLGLGHAVSCVIAGLDEGSKGRDRVSPPPLKISKNEVFL